MKLNKGDIYQHNKHNPNGIENNYTYEIVDIGFDTERQSEVVIYKPLYETEISVFVGPLENFLDTIEVNGQNIKRFKKVDSHE